MEKVKKGTKEEIAIVKKGSIDKKGLKKNGE
jgi:hypothetical protein